MSIATAVPPLLQPGQRLTREEFLRRWEAMPELKFAELIDGIVYMPSPLSIDHGDYDSTISYWLSTYAIATPGCKSGLNATWLMSDSAPQPDVHLRILTEFGGQSGREGKLGAGAPELVVEVCATSAAYDLGPKLKLYQRSGVLEYITLVLEPGEITWRELVNRRYKPLQPDVTGLLRSSVFPGLWLDPVAALAGDVARVLAVLQQGLASEEHAEFVRTLAARKPS